MGRFSKDFINNVVNEYQEGYIYYKIIKKSIRKVNSKKGKKNKISDKEKGLLNDPKGYLLNLLYSQLSNTLNYFRNYLANFDSEFNRNISSRSASDVYHIDSTLKKLISFALWNLKIINRSLTRFESVFHGSKKEFLSKNSEFLIELRNLDSFELYEKKIDERINMWKPSLDGLQEPLITKLEKHDILSVISLNSSVKIQLKSLKLLELFPRDPDYPDFFTLFLMVISSFIQQTNFYILALAANDYASYLGLPKTFSGILNCSTWISVVFFSFAYNYWTFFQYKLPTIICGLCMVIGNYLYFLGFHSKSIFLAILGRVLIGTGGSRIINRKYIRTYVNKSVQSNWNNFYLAGSIVGRGVGPILASSLYFIEYPSYDITGLSAPALLMCLLWAVYTVLVVLFFKEPEINNQTQDLNEQTGNIFSICLAIMVFMIPKIVHEAQITSIPIIASQSWGWDIDFIGVFIAAISLAVAPIYIFIGFTSDIFEHKQFTRAALLLTLIGTFLMISFDEMIEVQYIVGTFIMYLGANMDDSVTGLILSRLVSNNQENFINTGLLITVFGSLARGIGAISIALGGMAEDELEDLDDAEDLQNTIFVPMTVLCLIGFLLVVGFYEFISRRQVKIIYK